MSLGSLQWRVPRITNTEKHSGAYHHTNGTTFRFKGGHFSYESTSGITCLKCYDTLINNLIFYQNLYARRASLSDPVQASELAAFWVRRVTCADLDWVSRG